MSSSNFRTRLARGWNAFRNKDPAKEEVVYSSEPIITYQDAYTSRGLNGFPYHRYGVDKTIITALYNRIALDCSLVEIEHVKVNENNQYQDTVIDGLNNCLTIEANKDQTAREFIIDIVLTMMSGDGVAAVVPVDTTVSPLLTEGYDIKTMRVGTILSWKPSAVEIDLYNERNGKHEKLWLPKDMVAIVVNPFRSVMNAPNSTLRRLVDKLSVLDSIDAQTGAGKLDLIIQLPYTIRSETRKKEAEKRRSSIEEQLNNSKYGVAYADGAEKIVQLNRPVENNIMSQVEYLTSMLYSQLGLTEEIMNGTANESAMQNYYTRTVNPFLNAICDEFKRKFLSKTARSQGHSILYFRDPFSLTTPAALSEIADRLTRNEIASSNDMRSAIGWKPSQDPQADQLRNKNLNGGQIATQGIGGIDEQVQ